MDMSTESQINHEPRPGQWRNEQPAEKNSNPLSNQVSNNHSEGWM